VATWNCNLSVELGNGFFIFLAVLVGALVVWFLIQRLDDGKETASGADSYLAGLRRPGLAGRGV